VIAPPPHRLAAAAEKLRGLRAAAVACEQVVGLVERYAGATQLQAAARKTEAAASWTHAAPQKQGGQAPQGRKRGGSAGAGGAGGAGAGSGAGGGRGKGGGGGGEAAGVGRATAAAAKAAAVCYATDITLVEASGLKKGGYVLIDDEVCCAARRHCLTLACEPAAGWLPTWLAGYKARDCVTPTWEQVCKIREVSTTQPGKHGKHAKVKLVCAEVAWTRAFAAVLLRRLSIIMHARSSFGAPASRLCHCGKARRGLDRQQCCPRLRSEKDTKLAQKLGQLQTFLAVFQQECMGQLVYFGPT
jgi:hypothetical protein